MNYNMLKHHYCFVWDPMNLEPGINLVKTKVRVTKNVLVGLCYIVEYNYARCIVTFGFIKKRNV